MKLAIVPAQVTTVEDKVAGNLNLTQLILLAAPVFICGVLYVVLPKAFEPTVYKLVLIVIVMLGFTTMALRIRGILVFEWIWLLVRYNRRPRYYVLNKNDAYLRQMPERADKQTTVRAETKQQHEIVPLRSFTTHERAKFEELVSSQSTKLAFRRTRNKKGNLHVTITES